MSNNNDFTRITNAKEVDELIDFFREIGFEFFTWQLRTPEFLYSWEQLPNGFFDQYYDSQLDQSCAIAEAIRQKWQIFSFTEAREYFGQGANFKMAEDLWTQFGMTNGLVYFSGRQYKDSTMILTSSQDINHLRNRWGAHLALASWKMHEILADFPGLKAISRDIVKLSPKQLEVLQLNMKLPELTRQQQAEYLQISPRMLEKRKKQIAQKYGVSSFANAIAIVAKS